MNKNVSLLIVIIAVVASMFTVATVWQSGVLEGVFGIAEEPDYSTHEISWHDGICRHRLRGAHVDWVNGEPYELLHKQQYISAVKPGNRGETINIHPEFRHSSPFQPPLAIYRYHIEYMEYYIYLSEDGSTWDLVSSPGRTEEYVHIEIQFVGHYNDRIDSYYAWSPTQHWYPLPYCIIELEGAFAGYIKVEIKLHMATDLGLFKKDLYAWDIAKVLSGYGDISIMPDDDETPFMFTAGVDTVTIQYDVDYSGDSVGEPGNGWTIILYSPDGTSFETWDTVVDGTEGTVEWPIPLWVFNHWGVGNNQWKIKLDNGMIPYDTEEFLTIDNESLRPGKPEITFPDGLVYDIGDTVRVNMHSDPNEATPSPIWKFIVDVYYEDTGAYIYEDVEFIAVDGSASFQFEALRGDVEVAVKAYATDVAGRPSGYEWEAVLIRSPDPIPPEYVKKPGETLRFLVEKRFYHSSIYHFDTMRYEVLDDKGNTIYIFKEKPDSAESIEGGIHVITVTEFTIPCWPHEYGNWTIICDAIDEIPLLGDEELGVSHIQGFMVIEGSFFDNFFFAPHYRYIDLTFDIAGKKVGFEDYWTFPAPIWLSAIIWVPLLLVGVYVALIRMGRIKPIHIRKKKK